MFKKNLTFFTIIIVFLGICMLSMPSSLYSIEGTDITNEQIVSIAESYPDHYKDPNKDLECIDFVKEVLRRVGVTIGSGYRFAYLNANPAPREVLINDAKAGDVIQISKDSNEKECYKGMHSAIILSSRDSDRFFNVVDSNWGHANGKDEKGNTIWVYDHEVLRHKWNPENTIKDKKNDPNLTIHIYRFETAEDKTSLELDTASSQAAEQSAASTEKNFFGVIGDWFNNLWNNIVDIFTVEAAETPDKSATIASSQESQSEIQGSVTTETVVTIPPPSKPSLTSPYNWYQSLGEAPTLRWSGDENSISYYLIVNSSNTGDIKSGWITSTSWKPNLPNENYIYSWKVKAKNSQGVESEWSEKRNFSVASTTLIFEGDISFSPSSPSSADQIKIFASTTGWGGVGVTLRVSVNTAPDGSSSGEWRILKELSVPKFNEEDAPVWDTKGCSNGTYRIRVEAKGPDDPNWQKAAVIEKTYELINKLTTTSETTTETTETTNPPTAPPVEDLSSNPGSGAQIGTTVNIHAKATWNSDFRAMRLKIDGNIVYELGTPEFNYTWNTSGFSEGSHTIRLEVAAQGDNSWSNPTVRVETYDLTAVNEGLDKPVLSAPSNGALLPPGTDITLVCNSVNGAAEYLFEIWGGQYGGTHNTLGGWQSGTSRHIGTMSPGNVLWRVKARNSSGVESPWSDEWNFTPQ